MGKLHGDKRGTSPQSLKNLELAKKEKDEKIKHRQKIVRKLITTRIGDLNDPLSAIDVHEALKQIDPVAGNVSTETIRNDYKDIEREIRAEVESDETLKVTTIEMVQEIRATYQVAREEMWRLYYGKGVKDHVKAKILKDLQTMAKEHAEVLQSLGFLAAAPNKVQFIGKDGTPVDPPNPQINVYEMNMQFAEFLRGRFQKPPEIIHAETV